MKDYIIIDKDNKQVNEKQAEKDLGVKVVKKGSAIVMSNGEDKKQTGALVYDPYGEADLRSVNSLQAKQAKEKIEIAKVNKIENIDVTTDQLGDNIKIEIDQPKIESKIEEDKKIKAEEVNDIVNEPIKSSDTKEIIEKIEEQPIEMTNVKIETGTKTKTEEKPKKSRKKKDTE